jgi:hypothetical protein
MVGKSEPRKEATLYGVTWNVSSKVGTPNELQN